MKYFPAVIYQQLSRKYGAKELFLNFNAMGSQGIYQTFKQNSWKIKKNKVILNGQYSSWAKINAGIPQGSLLLLINISDLSDN